MKNHLTTIIIMTIVLTVIIVLIYNNDYLPSGSSIIEYNGTMYECNSKTKENNYSTGFSKKQYKTLEKAKKTCERDENEYYFYPSTSYRYSDCSIIK